MAWSTISTVVAGTPITAAWANTIRNNILETPAEKRAKTSDFFTATGPRAVARLAPSATAGQVIKAGSGAVIYSGLETANFPSGLTCPIGGIVMWKGAAGTIPAGFQICDGTNGTANLRDRFIVGAGNTYAVGASGGGATITPTHTHTWTITNTGSGHQHYIYGHLGTRTSPDPNFVLDYISPLAFMAAGNHRHFYEGNSDSGGGVHTHAYSSQAFGGAIDNNPRYAALYFIQRMS